MGLVFLAPSASLARPLLRHTERADLLHLDVRTRAVAASQENLRPTGSAGPYGMNYGDVAPAHVDAGPAVRIWYAEEGPHAVPAEDLDGSGVPDFVELLAAQLHGITGRFAADGWQTPLSDADRGLPDFGGDGRFDVYLLDFSQHFGSRADGFLVTEFCAGDEGRACGGYIVIENDFEGDHYPSISDAVRTLFSHEYAHAVGASYAAGASTWWDEGQATWSEHAYADVEHDVIRLASRWFGAPLRPLDDLAGPGEGWAYAGSTFVLHLAEVHGSAVIRETWEALADGTARTVVGALDAVLFGNGSSVQEAWSRFVEAAWFTGGRAAPSGVTPLPFAESLPMLTARAITVEALPYRHLSPKWSADPVRLVGLSALTRALVLRPCGSGEPTQDVLRFDPLSQRPQTLSPGDAPLAPHEESVFAFLGTPRRSAEHCVMLYDAADAPPLCETASCEPPCEGPACDEPPCEGLECEEPPCEGPACDGPPCGSGDSDAPCGSGGDDGEGVTPEPAPEGGGCAALPAPDVRAGLFGLLSLALLRGRRRQDEAH